MAETKKIHTNIYLDPAVMNAVQQKARSEGQTPSWVMENILAVAFGLKEWPKPPKKLKKAKELIK